MAVDNTYEEARNQRLQENKKRFEDLGILNLSKNLSALVNSEKKSKQGPPKPKRKAENSGTIEPRRSARARNPVSYRDDLEIDFRTLRKRLRSSSGEGWERYCQRPIEEVRLASYEERTCALQAAEKFMSNLQSGNPTCVKSMVRSHVYSCFWLGLPRNFCKSHLPKRDLDMTLEDEDGSAYDAKYLGHKDGLSGGWRGFALHKKLDDGDAVVFELVEQDKFKVYIFRVSSFFSSQKHKAKDEAKEDSTSTTSCELKEGTEPAKKSCKAEVNEDADVSNKQRQTRNSAGRRMSGNVKKSDSKNDQKDITERKGETEKSNNRRQTRNSAGKRMSGNVEKKSDSKNEMDEQKRIAEHGKKTRVQLEEEKIENGKRKPKKARLLRRRA